MCCMWTSTIHPNRFRFTAASKLFEIVSFFLVILAWFSNILLINVSLNHPILQPSLFCSSFWLYYTSDIHAGSIRKNTHTSCCIALMIHAFKQPLFPVLMLGSAQELKSVYSSICIA